MKPLSIQEQVNACIKHANRNGIVIKRFDFHPSWSTNNQVLAMVGISADSEYSYFSVALLISQKRIQKEDYEDNSYNLADALEWLVSPTS